MAGTRADAQNRWVGWIDSTGGQRGVWVTKVSDEPRLVRVFSEPTLASGLSLALPYVIWVEYQESGFSRGAWDIHSFDLRTRTRRVIASWSDGAASKHQPIPLPTAEGNTVVWEALIETGGVRRMCIRQFHLRSGTTRSRSCLPPPRFPHYPQLRDGRLAYIVNFVKGRRELSRPRVEGAPALDRLFTSGQLEDRLLRASDVAADGRGVAWVAQRPEYDPKEAGAVLYWSPQTGLLERNFTEFPPIEVELLTDYVVWLEPEYANQVFAVSRRLVDCKRAGLRLLPRRHTVTGRTVFLAGSDRDAAAIVVVHDDRKRSKMHLFSIRIQGTDQRDLC